jgi:hypothetical protein
MDTKLWTTRTVTALFGVMLAITLGGCAETVASEPASPSYMNRPSIELSRFQTPSREADSFQMVMVTKTEPSKSQFVKHQGQPVLASMPR